MDKRRIARGNATAKPRVTTRPARATPAVGPVAGPVVEPPVAPGLPVEAVVPPVVVPAPPVTLAAVLAAPSIPAAVSAAVPDAAVSAAPSEKDTDMDSTTVETQAKTLIADAQARTQDASDKGQKLFADATEFGKGNIEALVESGKIAVKGIEAMTQDATAYAKTQFEEATAAMKTLGSVKSPTDFFKLQGDFARTAFEAMVAHTSRSTEAVMKLAGEVAQPIQNRVAIATDKMKIAA